MATNGDDGKFYGPVHSVYIPFSKINGDYAFFLSFSFFLPLFFFSFFLSRIKYSRWISPHFTTSRILNLSMTNFDCPGLIFRQLSLWKTHRLIDRSTNLSLNCFARINFNFAESPFPSPLPLFLRSLSIVPRNSKRRFFYDEQKWFQPMFPTWTRAIVLSSSTVATCFRFNRFLLERKTLGNASKRVFDQR